MFSEGPGDEVRGKEPESKAWYVCRYEWGSWLTSPARRENEAVGV